MKETSLPTNENYSEIDFIVDKRELLNILVFANLIVEKRVILKQLQYVKISTSETSIIIESTDLDIYLYQEIPSIIKVKGQITINSQLFLDIIRRIITKDVKVRKDQKNNYLEIISGNSFFKLFTFDLTNFPTLEETFSNYVINFQIEASKLHSLIQKTVFSASSEDTRYNLNGIFLQKKKNELSSVATDAHRLALSKINLVQSQGEIKEFDIIIPKKSTTELLKILKDSRYSTSKVSIFIKENRIKFECDNFKLISKLINSSYPDYNSFIPKKNQNILKINKILLINAIERISTIINDKFRAIRVDFDPSKDSLTLSAFNDNAGSAIENIRASQKKDELCVLEGSANSISLNPSYIIEVLNVIEEELVYLYFDNESSPMVIKEKDSIFVVMPLRR